VSGDPGDDAALNGVNAALDDDCNASGRHSGAAPAPPRPAQPYCPSHLTLSMPSRSYPRPSPPCTALLPCPPHPFYAQPLIPALLRPRSSPPRLAAYSSSSPPPPPPSSRRPASDPPHACPGKLSPGSGSHGSGCKMVAETIAFVQRARYKSIG